MHGISQRSVAVGRRYMVKIGSRLAEVEVVGIQTAPRWRCHVRTLDTNRTIVVKGVQRLRPVQDTVAAMRANAAAKRDGIAAVLLARKAREDAAFSAAVEGAGWVEVGSVEQAHEWPCVHGHTNCATRQGGPCFDEQESRREAARKAREEAEVREGVRRFGRLLGGFLG
jgi:hypothetical protein